ncbi:SMI1/KNR4 family protein [Chryseobacterium sp. JUb7]|uniref:SMI1/KNR4 family protein n=1 Tax=Chryseobacterium sp. JUb7 TaxID=2940599 RepID=UPI002167DE42|nr:SMI1/KNR4 family protein [Chryseobacterium sp. JUb7]MCS3531608.1 cell wall assembly regulator SMI1 [Chryseobacterium sp. JUb7]
MMIIDVCEKALKELYNFSKEILYLGDNIKDFRIEEFENNIGYELPIDFKFIAKKHNGIILAGTEIYGLSFSLKENSLDIVYKFEHFDVDNPMPSYFFPFSPDGRGNHYCLDLSKLADGICPVVFWQWDLEYDDFENVEVSNNSFVDWVNEVLIDWSKDIYNYDGTEK